jgi:hypothetical protein
LAGKRSDEFYRSRRGGHRVGAARGVLSREVRGKAGTLAAFNTTAEFLPMRTTQEPRRLIYSWRRAAIVSNRQANVLTSAAKTETYLRDKLAKAVTA